MDCSLLGFSVHGIFQARVLEWVAISFSRKSSQPWDRTQVSCIVGRRFTVWATGEVTAKQSVPRSSVGKESAYNAGDPGLIPESGRSAGERDRLPTPVFLGFPCGSAGKESTKESTRSVGDLGSIPELGRVPGEGKDYPLQNSGLVNSIDCIVHGATKSRTWLSDFHFTLLTCQAVRWVLLHIFAEISLKGSHYFIWEKIVL